MSLRRPSAAKWRSGLALCALLVASISAPSHAQLPTAQTVAGGIRTGWNLGNTLEAQCGETAWGNPAVTQTLINSVKAAGFNAIRIPAAWNCHITSGTTIDPVWMARVKTVVDYAYNQGMYVILNIHWDGGWLQDHPTFDFQTANNQKQTALWTQIANTFKTYNERMLFAGTNEVHADYNEPTSEHITVQQSYNQSFVNAVRATGGNNATRTLVVQTYNTNAWHGLHYFTMPSDSAANRLIVEFHHYDPYDYTLNPSGPCLAWGAQFTQYSNCSWAQENYVTDLFSQIRTKWVAAGIPVIMGEYGVARRSNLDEASRQYYLEFTNRTATTNGIKTFYWDNGAVSGASDVFALFNRSTGATVDANGLNAIMRGVGGSSSTFALAVTKSGTGTGTVTSSPAGISCGIDLQRELQQRNVRHADGRGGQRIDVRQLGRRVQRHGHGLHRVDDCGAQCHRHVQQLDRELHAQRHESRQRHGHCHVGARGHQLRQHLQRQLLERHFGDAHGGGRQWRELRGLERRLLGHRHLHRVDDPGAFGDGDVQHGVHVRVGRHARGHRQRYRDFEPERHQLRHLVHG